MTILNTSVSGMLADSNWLSSISQNVANANTTGYKNAETEFSTLVDQVSTAAAGGGVMTTLEAVSIERILSPGQPVPGRQAEDLTPQEIARVMVAIQRMRRDKIEEIKELAVQVLAATGVKAPLTTDPSLARHHA